MIRTAFKMSIAVLALMALSACGGSDDEAAGSGNTGGITASSPAAKVADAYLTQLDDIASAVEKISDEASAKDAAKAIQSAKNTMEAMAEEYKGEWGSVGSISALTARQQEFIQVQTRLSSAMSKLAMQNPDLLKMVNQEMRDLPQMTP